MTGEARSALDAFMVANARGKHGRIVYDLKGDLGFDAQALRERFAFYFERFPIREEAH